MKRITLLLSRLYEGRKKRNNAPRQIVMSFALVILAGALLLMLPISSISGERTSFLDALFTATSATCVTGLVVADTGAYFSLFGQGVILALIQIGGLGFMTILVIVAMRGRKMNMRSRLVVAQTLSIDSMSDISNVTARVFRLTFAAEGIGALILAARFVPQFGIKGIWYGVFHSVSAFCNAGFDIFGRGDSLCAYNADPIVMLTVCALVILGGIGFLVIEDIRSKRSLKKLALYSVLVLGITLILLVSGMVLFWIFESCNPNTIGNMPLWQQGLNSFFQSVTCRTAGFDSIGQAALTEQSKLVSVLLMMVGGASGSTAGGVKVVTVGVVALTLITSLKSRENVIVRGRHIPHRAVHDAMMLVVLWFTLVMSAALFVSFIGGFSLIDSLYEVTSAYGTAGLSVGLTAEAESSVRILLIIYMFFGRVGVMTISVIFITRSGKREKVNYPEGRVIIG